MFIDEVKIYARAGHGGKGCVAFHREAYRPKGGPSGGNGGRGGDVILEASHDLNNLIAQFYEPRLVAQDGQNGLGKGMDGVAGKDLVIKVPVGTLVWRLPTQPSDSDQDEVSEEAFEEESTSLTIPVSGGNRAPLKVGGSPAVSEPVPALPSSHWVRPKGELVMDFLENGQRFVLCKGGRGGLGNRNFATARRQTPRFAQPGEEGGEGEYLFELRIMADVGVVGFPNAGKSTLLSAISRARPKIAPYPFTTLHPQIGIVEYSDFKRLTVCDVPGLIQGAHNNVGLGHAFLRHIERCKILVILLDMAGTDGRKPWDDYKDLLNELELYDPVMLEKPRVVVANKMDEEVAEANLKSFKRRIRKTPVLQIAAAFDEGLEKFKQTIREQVEESSGSLISHAAGDTES